MCITITGEKFLHNAKKKPHTSPQHLYDGLLVTSGHTAPLPQVIQQHQFMRLPFVGQRPHVAHPQNRHQHKHRHRHATLEEDGHVRAPHYLQKHMWRAQVTLQDRQHNCRRRRRVEEEEPTPMGKWCNCGRVKASFSRRRPWVKFSVRSSAVLRVG